MYDTWLETYACGPPGSRWTWPAGWHHQWGAGCALPPAAPSSRPADPVAATPRPSAPGDTRHRHLTDQHTVLWSGLSILLALLEQFIKYRVTGFWDTTTQSQQRQGFQFQNMDQFSGLPVHCTMIRSQHLAALLEQFLKYRVFRTRQNADKPITDSDCFGI